MTGRSAIASTCHYSQYLTGMTVVLDGCAPRTGPDGAPVLMIVFFPPEKAEIIDTWHTLGMRGTGSHDISVCDIFVPDHHAWIMSPFGTERSGPFAGPLYGALPWIQISCHGSVALGIGQAAIDELIALAGTKTPSYTDRSLRDREVAQANVARAQATIGAAIEHKTGLITGADRTPANAEDGRPV